MKFGTTDWIPSLLLILFHRPFFLPLLLTLNDISHLIFNFVNDLFWRCFNSVFVLCNCEHKHSFGPTGFGSAEFWALSLKYFWSHEITNRPWLLSSPYRTVGCTIDDWTQFKSTEQTESHKTDNVLEYLAHFPFSAGRRVLLCVWPARILWR